MRDPHVVVFLVHLGTLQLTLHALAMLVVRPRVPLQLQVVSSVSRAFMGIAAPLGCFVE